MPDPLTRQGFHQRLGYRPFSLLSRQDVADAWDKKAKQPTAVPSKTLVERIGRAKTRWLKRVVYGPDVSSTGNCFAHALADRRHCVTLDRWPRQARPAQFLGFASVETVRQVAHELELSG